MTAPKRQASRQAGNVRVLFLIAVLGLAGVSIAMLHLRSSQQPTSSDDSPMLSTPASATPDTSNSETPSAGAATHDPLLELQRAEAEVETARLEFANANRAVSDAESLIARSERDLEDLERFVEELEEQGEDPADHAEEGLRRFMPAFEAYEIADEALERAQATEALERIKLDGAEQRLLEVQRRLGAESQGPC